MARGGFPMGGGMNMQQMMMKAQKMQQEIQRKQQELEETRNELVEEKEELEELMQAGDDESYVIRMARRFWGLFFPDEEIFFNDRNS